MVEQLRVTERDELILREIDRRRACRSRHIRFLAGFSGQRATDRRLKILTEAEYIERRKYLYGVPYIYFLTAKGKSLIHIGTGAEKIKIEQITHDRTVLDTAIYFMQKKGLSLQSITTEKQLHQFDGFGIRKHRPNFIFTKDELTHCVEVELTKKAKNRLLNIVKDNFMEYDTQIWVVPNYQTGILQILNDSQRYYDNMKVYSLQKITDYLNKLK